jgi:hypothetical protein
MAPRLNFLTGCFGWQPTKLSRCNEHATQAWMWALQLTLVIPTAMAAFSARSNYLLIAQYPQLSQYPYHPKAELAFFITYIGVCTKHLTVGTPSNRLINLLTTKLLLTDCSVLSCFLGFSLLLVFSRNGTARGH